MNLRYRDCRMGRSIMACFQNNCEGIENSLFVQDVHLSSSTFSRVVTPLR